MVLKKYKINADSIKMTTSLMAGNHQFYLDDSIEAGGEDKGMHPLNAFLGILAGSLNNFAHIIATKKKFELKGIEFNVEAQLDPRVIEVEDAVSPSFETITIYAEVDTPESNKKIQELKKDTESRCPLFNLIIGSEIELESTWVKKS